MKLLLGQFQKIQTNSIVPSLDDGTYFYYPLNKNTCIYEILSSIIRIENKKIIEWTYKNNNKIEYDSRSNSYIVQSLDFSSDTLYVIKIENDDIKNQLAILRSNISSKRTGDGSRISHLKKGEFNYEIAKSNQLTLFCWLSYNFFFTLNDFNLIKEGLQFYTDYFKNDALPIDLLDYLVDQNINNCNYDCFNILGFTNGEAEFSDAFKYLKSSKINYNTEYNEFLNSIHSSKNMIILGHGDTLNNYPPDHIKVQVKNQLVNKSIYDVLNEINLKEININLLILISCSFQHTSDKVSHIKNLIKANSQIEILTIEEFTIAATNAIKLYNGNNEAILNYIKLSIFIVGTESGFINMV